MSPRAETQSLDLLHRAVGSWFRETFGTPTEPQIRGWSAIASGEHTLIQAPTGSGKTLAAFLVGLSDLYRQAEQGADLTRPSGIHILYVSPLRALNNDIHRNLEIPLAGIAAHAEQLGMQPPALRSAVRTSDTPAAERQRLLRRPPHILITTPESLSLMLISSAQQILKTVRTVIIDEIHALFPNKRGAQLALSLEHLAEVAEKPFQRIGLSATQRPLDLVAGFLGGGTLAEGQDMQCPWHPRRVTIVQAPGRKELDFQVMLPVTDFASLPEHSVWPEVYRSVWQMVEGHRSTLVFVNNRQTGERLAAALNDLAGADVCRVHHGSIAREQRLVTERLLRSGDLRCLVATSTLELGIDIGWIDLVVQVESPHEVTRGLQRVGRAGHIPGARSKGRLLAKSRDDLLEAAVVSEEMLAGRIEPAAAQENALDVLAQFLVAFTVGCARQVGDLHRAVRRSYNYRNLERMSFEALLTMVAGDYDLGPHLVMQPLVVWDRTTGFVLATARGRRLVQTSGGTIADRGYYGVYLEGSSQKLGELDEEYVSERRLGDRLTLGTSSWRINRITADRVLVAPTPGGPPVPFWRGDALGRSYLLGQAIADFLAQTEVAFRSATTFEEADRAVAYCRPPNWADAAKLEPDAAAALWQYLSQQRAATGILPSSKHLVLEEFRDELGQWRTVIHSRLGRRVNEPLAVLLTPKTGPTPDVVVTDDAVLLAWGPSEAPRHLDLTAATEQPNLREHLAAVLRGSPLFGRLFREAAGRALLLPRRPGWQRRTPLWLTRRKAAALLEATAAVPGFPMIQEAAREALSSHWDLAGLQRLLEAVSTGQTEVVRVQRQVPSPFARHIVFAAAGAFMYGDDLPHAERRLRHLGLDQDSLRQLLGQAPLRQLLDASSIREAQQPGQPATLVAQPPASADDLHWWLRRYGELPVAPLPTSLQSQLSALAEAGRAQQVDWSGAEAGAVWIASEDLPEYLGLPGAAAPPSPQSPQPLEAAGAGHSPDWLRRLVMRFARRNGPFHLASLVARYGVASTAASRALASLVADGHLQAGEFTPDGRHPEWIEPAALESIHRHSLARARRAVQPVTNTHYAEFLLDWHGIPSSQGGVDQLAKVLRVLRGLRLPAPDWERQVLPIRVRDYRPEMLDTLIASGQYRWVASGTQDAPRIEFWPAQELPRQTGAPAHPSDSTGLAIQATALLADEGPAFFQDIWQALGGGPADVLMALSELMLRGEVTNDAFGPARSLLVTAARHGPATLRLTPALIATMGRWSLVQRPQRHLDQQVDDLLDAYGLVSREVATGRGHNWPELSAELRRREVLGAVRRGYFVTGLSGMQYAVPEAVERLRAAVTRHGEVAASGSISAAARSGEAIALSWQDPALAWGRLLEWPGDFPHPRPPFWLVMRAGRPVLVGQGNPLRLSTADQTTQPELLELLQVLAAAVQSAQPGRLEVVTYNGEPVRWTHASAALADLGFTAGPDSMVRYRSST